MSKTNIPYCDESCNPVVGCTPCSPACNNCWSQTLHEQRHYALLAGKKIPQQYSDHFCKIKLLPERLEELKHLKKPRTIFMCSGSDLFHECVPDEFIDNVFHAMWNNYQHNYILLTKRIKRAQVFFDSQGGEYTRFPNISLGITIWNQESADRDIPILLDCWKGSTWISAEPMLGKIKLPYLKQHVDCFNCRHGYTSASCTQTICATGFRVDSLIDYVVVGCESGRNRRPCKDEWLDPIAEQCKSASVPCLIKQREISGKVVACKPEKDFFRRIK